MERGSEGPPPYAPYPHMQEFFSAARR